MNSEARKTIEAVIKTLNCVSVSGKPNMDMLLGSILALEKLLKDDPQEEKKKE